MKERNKMKHYNCNYCSMFVNMSFFLNLNEECALPKRRSIYWHPPLTHHEVLCFIIESRQWFRTENATLNSQEAAQMEVYCWIKAPWRGIITSHPNMNAIHSIGNNHHQHQIHQCTLVQMPIGRMQDILFNLHKAELLSLKMIRSSQLASTSLGLLLS